MDWERQESEQRQIQLQKNTLRFKLLYNVIHTIWIITLWIIQECTFIRKLRFASSFSNNSDKCRLKNILINKF